MPIVNSEIGKDTKIHQPDLVNIYGCKIGERCSIAAFIEIGADVVIGNKNVTIYDSVTIIGNVVIEDHVWVGPFCLLDGGGGLYIGEFTDISTGCQILTHDTVKCALSGGKQPYEYAPVYIGKCCFIGTHTVILKGVTLGDHCLVASNSLVNKSFPSYSIVGGMPATQIGRVIILKDGRIDFKYFRKRV